MTLSIWDFMFGTLHRPNLIEEQVLKTKNTYGLDFVDTLETENLNAAIWKPIKKLISAI